MAYNVGDVVTLDGIESVIIYDAGSEQEWGRYIVTDRFYNLSHYTQNSDNFYNLQWLSFFSVTGITSQEIGDGLSNTNSLISLNSSQNSSKTVWNMVEDFREQYSDKFFIPTLKEIHEIYLNKSYLLNLTDNYGDLDTSHGVSAADSEKVNPTYSSSSEIPAEIIEDSGLSGHLEENSLYYKYNILYIR